MKPPKRDSISRLNTFAEICERRYFYDCFEPWQDSTAQARGRHVHTALEYAGTIVLAGATWETALYKAIIQVHGGPLSKVDVQMYLEAAAPIVRTLTPVAVEHWFENNPWPDFCGKIDMVSTTAPILDQRGHIIGEEGCECVVDYKTLSPGKKPDWDDEARKRLQLRIYCLATETKTGIYVWLPWRGPACATRIDFTDEELAVTEKWARMELDVLRRRWENTLSEKDPSQFALAAPGHPLCSERWCSHYGKCFPKG